MHGVSHGIQNSDERISKVYKTIPDLQFIALYIQLLKAAIVRTTAMLMLSTSVRV